MKAYRAWDRESSPQFVYSATRSLLGALQHFRVTEPTMLEQQHLIDVFNFKYWVSIKFESFFFYLLRLLALLG